MRDDDSDSSFSEELKMDDEMMDDLPHHQSGLERNKSAVSELTMDDDGDSSVDSSELFDTISETFSQTSNQSIRHISFAHQEPSRSSLSSELRLDDDDDDDNSFEEHQASSSLSFSARSADSRSYVHRGRKRQGPGSQLLTLQQLALSPRPLQSEQSDACSQYSRDSDGNSVSQSSLVNSDRSSVILSIAKRHVYGDPLSISDRSSSRSPVPPSSRKKKNRLSNKFANSKRLSHRESLSRSSERPSSWSPVPPSDRKAGKSSRYSVSSSKPNSERMSLDDPIRSASRSPVPMRGKKKGKRNSLEERSTKSFGSSYSRGGDNISVGSPVPPRSSKNNKLRIRRTAQLDDPLVNSSERSTRSGGSYDFEDDLSRSYKDDASCSHFSRRTTKVDDMLSVSERLMATTDHDGKMRAVMDGLSMNKLQYDKVGLVGREKETEILRRCYARLITDKSSSLKKELVFVHGYSGVGKSTLVSSVMEICDQSSTGFCARGKFDFSSVDLPYTAIATAFGQILLDNAEERRGTLSVSTYDESGQLQTLGQALNEKLGPDMHLLARLIPELKGMIPASVRQPSFRRRSNDFDDAGQNRWEHALLVLTRELNKIYSPLVLFLDDMKWADNASLNLIDALISDVENKNPFMIVGCYRSNAVGQHHILPRKVQQLAKKQANYGFNLSEIEIENLDKEGVQAIIMTLLSMDDKKATEALADICFRRTLGNPFFLMEFMAMLSDERLIEFSLGLMKWTWNEEEIERETMSTENVVDIVHSRMKKLSKSAQTILEYAACLGSTIRLECLEILISKLEAEQEGEVSLSASMKPLVKGGFIERIQGDEYRWVHDNVRESALMLGDAGSRLFQFDVGNTLFHSLDPVDLEEMLFEVCDLINLGEHSRRKEFAKLNLRAAEKARRLSAFETATDYANKGIGYLQNGKWTDQQDLTLKLYNLAMEMCMAVGNVEEAEKYSEEILAQSNCTPIELLPVYLAKSHKMTHMDMDYKGCTDLLLGILNENFKIQLLTKKAMIPMQATTSLLNLARKVKKLPKGVLRKLKPVNDPECEAAMELLARVSISAYHGEEMLLHVRCITKMVQMTMKHGVHSMSGFAFVGLGTCILAINGDSAEAASFASMAEELQAIAPDDYAAASISTTSNLLVLPWSSTLHHCRSALKEGYSRGLRAGNTENAMLSLFVYNISMPFQMGKPLSSIESKCAAIAAQCEELKLGLYVVLVRQFWELILRLMGTPDQSVFSESVVLKQEGWKAQAMMSEYMELNMSVYSGDFQTAAEIATRMGDGFSRAHPSSIHIMSETFLRAIALYAEASNSKTKRRQANKLRQKMGNWVKRGNPNVGHCYHLLCAEKNRLDKNYPKANELYNDAIVLAARTGHLHHAALANERYAHFLLDCRKDKDESDYRIKEAIRFYQDWGAEQRVHELTKQMDVADGC